MRDEAAKLCLGREQKCGAGRGVRGCAVVAAAAAGRRAGA
eukprot:COSAG01_NODE_42785_length_436_cov_2.026706_1_plen_39_part_10